MAAAIKTINVTIDYYYYIAQLVRALRLVNFAGLILLYSPLNF